MARFRTESRTCWERLRGVRARYPRPCGGGGGGGGGRNWSGVQAGRLPLAGALAQGLHFFLWLGAAAYIASSGKLELNEHGCERLAAPPSACATVAARSGSERDPG